MNIETIIDYKDKQRFRATFDYRNEVEDVIRYRWCAPTQINYLDWECKIDRILDKNIYIFAYKRTKEELENNPKPHMYKFVAEKAGLEIDKLYFVNCKSLSADEYDLVEIEYNEDVVLDCLTLGELIKEGLA